MLINPKNRLYLPGTFKPLAIACSALIMTACVGGGGDSSSSIVDNSSATLSSSSIQSRSSSSQVSSSEVVSSSVPSSAPVSSSEAPSSSSLSSSSSSEVVSSSSEVSSSSAGAPSYGEIIPRTTCPSGPVNLEIDSGEWTPHTAVADPVSPDGSFYDNQFDVVRDYRDLMATQTPLEFERNGTTLNLDWNMYEPYQAEGAEGELFPLVVYLHGGSERGDGAPERFDEAGSPPHIHNRHAKSIFASINSLLTDENRETRPAYMVAPFCDSRSTRSSGDMPYGVRTNPECSFGQAEWASSGNGRIQIKEGGSIYGGAVEALVEKLIAEKRVDPARIYVTGPSMGGGGSWDFAARRPDLIAAAIPLAGHPLVNSGLDILIESKVPVWSHHGINDGTNRYGDAKAAIEYMQSEGGCAWQTTYLPAKYPDRATAEELKVDDPGDTNASDAIHNIWARAYTNPELWDWVFAQAQPREGGAAASSVSSNSSVITQSSESAGSSSSAPRNEKPLAEVEFSSNELKRCIEESTADYVYELQELACSQAINDWGGLQELTSLSTLKILGGYYNQPLVINAPASLGDILIFEANIGSLEILGGEKLEQIQLENPGRLGFLDLSNMDKLKRVRLVNTELSGVALPAGVALDELEISESENIGCNFLTEVAFVSPSTTMMHDIADCDTTPPSGVNHYDAKKATIAPIIDGVIDDVWANADVDVMDEFWTFEGLVKPPNAADLDVTFRALWDENYLYLLVEVTDDIKVDNAAFWQGDTVEIFIDEDRSGGNHANGNRQAFAYHVNHKREVIDVSDLSDHVDFEIVQDGNDYIWEFAFKVYGNYGNGNGNAEDALRKLYAGKIMGFTPSYIDNDGDGREHFVSTVFTELHNENQGYINADSFGTLMLVE